MCTNAGQAHWTGEQSIIGDSQRRHSSPGLSPGLGLYLRPIISHLCRAQGESNAADDAMAKSSPVRKEVDLAYQRFVSSIFQTLERIAGLDSKHGDRLRLENYSYFEEAVRPLVRHVEALESFCEKARMKQVKELAEEYFFASSLMKGVALHQVLMGEVRGLIG